ncbi:MAG: MT-A70 family methyltransferase [Alphaproteobacteria bacterium]|nr:MT-A70 family methyltransferase [Alphaproteobacteria bacterium]
MVEFKSRLITSGPFKGLLRNHYKAILADPPWAFAIRSAKGGGRSAEKHYGTMSLDEIAALPVKDLAAKDCVLFMWITDPMLFKGIDMMKAWGFDYKTVGFYWVKLNQDGKTPFTGMGFWTRANPEQVLTNLDEGSQLLLGAQGHPKRQAMNVPKLIMAPRREHSRKPDEIFERIEALVEGPYLELFARQARPKWTTWGNEREKFNPATFDEEDLIG